MTDSTLQDAPPQAPASLWEDFIDIFYAPRQVFERRRHAKFGLVLLIITLLTTALFAAMQGPLGDAISAEMQRGMQAGGNAQQMTPEQMEGARRMGRVFGPVAVLIGFPIGVMLTGVALWLVGKIFDFSAGVGMAILIVTYAQFPRLLQSVLTLLQGLVMEADSLSEVSIGPARFLDPATTGRFAMAMLMRVDVFYIWSTILIAIGAQVIGRVPKAQSYVLAVVVWLVGAIPQLPALFMG